MDPDTLELMGDQEKLLALLTRLGLAVDTAGDGLLSSTLSTMSKAAQQKTLKMGDVDHLARMLEGRHLQGLEATDIKAAIGIFRVTAQMFTTAHACDTACAGQKRGGSKATKVQETVGTEAQGQQCGGSSIKVHAHREVGQKHEGTRTAAHALGQHTQHRALTLAQILDEKPRLPKPRNTSTFNGSIWQGARNSAMAEVVEMYDISKGLRLQEYYSQMCRVGKQLLVDTIHNKTQSLYDYRVSKSDTRSKKSESAA